MTSIIDRNTTIPVKKSKVFSTAVDSQPSVTVHILQGERQMASDNKSLGQFELMGIPPAPRGVPQIEVAFDIDADGIIHVSAKDKGTGKEQSITIKSPSGLSDEEVENLVTEAKNHEEEDKKKKDTIEARNKLEGLIYTVEKSLKEHSDKIEAGVKQDIEKSVADAKMKLESDNVEEINAAFETLSTTSQKMAQFIYEQSQQDADPGQQVEAPQQEAAAGGQQAGGVDENVVDADFEVDEGSK